MRSFFEMGFNGRWKRPVLGQLDFLPTIISAGLQAGASVYGAHMQQTIAQMQKKTQEDIANKQAAASQAEAKAQQQQTQQQAQQQQIQAATAPKILGVDRDVAIMGGVGLALVVGIIAIVASGKSSTSSVQTAVAQ